MPNYTVTNNIDTLLRSTSNAAARTNLGLGDAATKSTGITAGTVAAGDDSRIVGAVQTTRTVSAGTGLTGGGDLSANRTISVSFGSTAGTACEGNDARLSDSRTPTAHATSHAAAGSDPITITSTQISGNLTQNTTGTAANVTGTVAIANGGTGQTTATAAINALLPSQASNNNKVLSTDGTNTSWASTLKFAQTKTVGVDATTIQGCIDLVTSASWNNQTQILIPPGVYTENLTLKPCVSLASTGGNNGQGSVVRIVGVHTATGSATAGDSVLEINGIRFDNTTTSPTITFSSNGSTSFLVHIQDCLIGNSNASTAVSGVVVNANVVIRAVNVRSLANATAGIGGTHWDLNGGSLYTQGCSTEYGTCALLMRGTNGANYPYAELKGSYFTANGANLISITSTTALLTAGWCSFENRATTGNGVNIAAGSVAGIYNSAFIVTSGASNYVVTGAAGCAYFSTGNSYSNSSLIAYETKIGASVAQYAYTSTDVSKSGDTMSGKLTLTNNGTTAPLNLGAQANVGTLSAGDVWINSGGVLSWRTSGGATIPAVITSTATNFTAGVGSAIGSSTTPALVVQQNGSNAALTVANTASGTSDCVTITNLGSGNSLVVNDETTPDSTRFAIANNGRVGIGVTPDASVALAVDSTGIKFGDGTIQTTASGGSAGVSSFSAGTTGLTPATGTTGAVTLAGTLAIANGGTGATTQQAALNAVAGATTSGQFLRGNGTNVTMSAIQAADVPTLNQNTTGTAANVTGTVAIANGGTGQTTRQAAMSALAGATTSGQYLRGNGTDVVMSAIQAGDVPTLNQNTTGTAANVTGTVAAANGGTGQTTYTNGQLLIGNAAGGLTKATLTAGSNVTITNGDGAITIASTGVGGGGITALTGDVTASGSGSVAASVVRVQGRNVASTAPTSGQVLGWNSSTSQWEPTNAGGAVSYDILKVFIATPGSGSYAIPSGYKYADITACSGGGGGGAGAYFYGIPGGGGGGGAHGILMHRRKLYVSGSTIDYTIGAGGAGGQRVIGGMGGNGAAGGGTLVQFSTGANPLILDCGYQINSGGLSTQNGQGGGNYSGSAGYILTAIYIQNLQNGGAGGYNGYALPATQSVYTQDTTYVSSGGGGGGTDSGGTNYNGGNILDQNYILYTSGVANEYQGTTTSSLDPTSVPDLSIFNVFYGGAGGAAGTSLQNIADSGLQRAGNGANGQYGCGGGGGGAMYDTTGNYSLYVAGNGGNGGDGFLLMYLYK